MSFWSSLLRQRYYLRFSKRIRWTGYTKPMESEYFTEKELHGLRNDFKAKLIVARKKTIELDPDKKGVPFRISSGYRTPENNKSVIGAVPDSSHIKGLAVDVRVYSGREVAIIVQGCYSAGIYRIGFYVDKDFNLIHLHLDDDRDKPTPTIFVKQEQN